MFRVLVSDKLASEGIAVFEAAEGFEVDVKPGLPEADLAAIIADYDALAIRSGTKVTRALLEKAKRLKAVGRAGIGVDNVDVAAASEAGVLVMNTPEGNVVTTAEHAVALMCSLVRKIPQATRSMMEGKWEKSKFSGRELMNKTLGIIGLGNIGKIVASRGLGLKMRVVASDPFVTKARAKELGVELVELDDLISCSDIITLHVPLTAGTKNIIGEEALQKVKRGAFLINAARGGLVDETAVVRALDDGRLAGAAFDVYVDEPPPADHPFFGRDDVVLTPHLGASTSEAQVNVAVSVAHQLVDYISKGIVTNGINAPALSPEEMETLGPYVEVAECVGRVAGQLHGRGVQSIRLSLAGVPRDVSSKPLEVAALTGILRNALGPDVNTVSAPYVAQERGIEVVVERSNTARDFANAISVRVSGDRGDSIVTGALFGAHDARIVGIDQFRLEIVPKGRILLTDHFDRPGIIGKIGTVLGRHDVNISRLNLSRTDEDKRAKAAISIDGAVSDEVTAELRAIDGIENVSVLNL